MFMDMRASAASLNKSRRSAPPMQQRQAHQTANDASKAVENDRFKNACADFEAIFIHHMFQSMKQTLPGEDLFGQSSQKDMYESMYHQEIATQLARGKGLGMGEALYRQLMNQQKIADAQKEAGSEPTRSKEPDDRNP
jgi:flagellar protein FlgJ